MGILPMGTVRPLTGRLTAGAFDPDTIVPTLQNLPGFSLAAKSSDTLHVLVRGIKASFVDSPRM